MTPRYPTATNWFPVQVMEVRFLSVTVFLVVHAMHRVHQISGFEYFVSNLGFLIH
jgi:hypothetical protein